MIERTVKNPHRLVDVGEYFAAGLFDDGSDSVAQSFAKGLSQWATHLTLPEYDGGDLYPHGPSFWDQSDMAVGWFYVCATPLKTDVYDRKLATADDEEKRALEAMADLWRAYEFPGGYTHSIPNYRRALAEGLDGFQTRMESGAKEASANRESARSEFYGAMETTLNTAHILHRRVVALLELAVTTDDQSETNRLRLLDAYSRVPFGTPQTFFDALVSTNFLFYLDGCDDLGRFDQYLRSFFEADVNLGLLEHDEAVRLVRAQWKNVDDSTSWNAAIGGVDTEGSDLSSDLTEICLEAARGMRRPNLALRLGPSTPENVWQSAMDTVESGCGLPALYWDPNYYAAMDSSEIPIPVDEKHEYAFGGCTELMVDGKSNVGSLDGDLNLPEVLFQTISNHLSRSEDFEQFYRAYQADLNSAVETLTSLINTWQECKSKWHPQPIRSLLIDDCIDTGVEYSNGGARYNWSVINVMGLANAVDSLSAIKKLVFDEAEVSGQGITDALAAEFEGYEELRVRLERAPRYG
ncbi:MAG: pyruvate formate lyase family protein, partial [Candidatus Latescibacteria bacterium]|nr:pyruvate formate lyase family protein [Candidatus Latescibacterota bacterium]